MRRWARLAAGFILVLIVLSPGIAAIVGARIGPGILDAIHWNPQRLQQAVEMLQRTGATKQDLDVRAPDGIELRG